MASSLLCVGLAANYFTNLFPDKSILLTLLSASSSENANKSKTLNMNFVADLVEIVAPAVVHVSPDEAWMSSFWQPLGSVLEKP